jgi:hypothetical protein
MPADRLLALGAPQEDAMGLHAAGDAGGCDPAGAVDGDAAVGRR